MPDGSLQIPSYRLVFDLERRIHRIDRFRVPLPYGLPLRSLAYALGALVAVLLLQQLAGTRQFLGVLPPPARLALLPLAISYGLTRLKPDGRSAHAAAGCWLRYVLAPRELVAFRAGGRDDTVRLPDVVMAPDGNTARRWRGTIIGPATVVGGVANDQVVLEAGERLALR